MKKFVVCLCLSVLGLATWADSNINLTQDVREKHAAGSCGEPAITGAGNASYPYSNAFDGVTSNKDGKYRWLSAGDGKMDSAWAQFVAPDDYMSGSLFQLAGYRLSRMYDGSYDRARAPTKWEILGVCLDGSTEVILTNTYTWGTSDADATRIQTFMLPPSVEFRYRGFRFHPLANTTDSSDTVKFGLLEVEFFIKWSGGSWLSVGIDNPELVATCSPAVGQILTEPTTCTASEEARLGILPYQCCGYTLEQYVDGEWTGGSVTNVGCSYEFPAEEGSFRLTWRYVPRPIYNLVPTIRQAGYTATASGPTAGADWPASNVFDGILNCSPYAADSDEAKRMRWLCLKSSSPYVRVDIDPAYHSDFDIRPVGYRVWRLYDKNDGTHRQPTDWTLKGVVANGTVTNTVSTVSGVTWKEGMTDAVRMKEFPIETQTSGNYRAFIFTPTETQLPAELYTGLFELEILVEEVASVANVLTIASAEGGILDCEPTAGATLKAAGTCQRLSKGYFGTSRRACAGYKLYRFKDLSWVEIASDPSADTFEWDGTGGMLKLEWQWGDVDGYKLDVSTYGQETYVFSPAADARGFYDAGTQVSVTPVGQTDPASAFLAWAGDDVPGGSATAVPLVITVDRYKTVRGDFTRHWKHVPETEGGSDGVFTDGNWVLRVAADTYTPVGDYKADLLLSPGAYCAGQGVLDFSTLTNDTGRILSTIRANSMTNRTGLVSLVLPPGLGRIAAPSFAYSPDLGSVILPDSVRQLDGGNASTGDGGVFGGCVSLSNVVLSANLVYLGNQSFGGCVNLRTVTPFLPQSLTYLGSAFQECTALAGTPDLTSVQTLENGCFRSCSGIVGDYDLTGKIFKSGNKGAFEGTGINSARISSAGGCTFYGCTSLTNVTFTDGCTSVEVSLFEGCTALTEVNFPVGITKTADRLFYGCTSLIRVTFASPLTQIAVRTFTNCPNLESITTPDDFAAVTLIDDVAFGASAKIVSTLPADWPNVTRVGKNIFYSLEFPAGMVLRFPKIKTLAEQVFHAVRVESVDCRNATFTQVPARCFYRDHTADELRAGYVSRIGSVYLPPTATALGSETFGGWNDKANPLKLHFAGALPSVTERDDAKMLNGTFAGCGEYEGIYIYVPSTPELLATWTNDVNFVALADIPDREEKDTWDMVKNDRHLIGAWRKKWCFTWNPNPPKGLLIFVQ